MQIMKQKKSMIQLSSSENSPINQVAQLTPEKDDIVQVTNFDARPTP